MMQNLARSTLRVAQLNTAARCLSTSHSNNMKVAVLGGAGGIGQPLSMLLKLAQEPAMVHELAVYDINHAKGVGADLSHIDMPCQVRCRCFSLSLSLNCLF